jgi:hypothetical protein
MSTETTDAFGPDNLRALLREMHAAGWRHTRDRVPMHGRDELGAPWSDDEWDVHRWTRGPEHIEAFWDRASGTGLGWINYDPDAESGYDDNMVSVGRRRTEQMGVAGLRRLSAALDVMPAGGAR